MWGESFIYYVMCMNTIHVFLLIMLCTPYVFFKTLLIDSCQLFITDGQHISTGQYFYVIFGLSNIHLFTLLLE